jgi:pimeloyl-ACP methyl ester carboxylesterase
MTATPDARSSLTVGTSRHASRAVDKTVSLDVHGTHQSLRLCAAREGLPPILIVQAGPGFALLNEVGRFQQSLDLERDFLVAYWDQRGCGAAASRDIEGLSLQTQTDDLCFVVRWLAEHTGKKVVVLGISLGATLALRAAAHAEQSIKALVLLSLDTDTAASDASVAAFLHERSALPDGRKTAKLVEKLGAPPYLSPPPFQLRARLLSDLGVIERGKRFGQLVRGLLSSLVGTYGLVGAVKTVRNINAIQRRMLPELATLNLFAHWPERTVPIHHVFGESDPLVPACLVQKIAGTLVRDDSVTVLPNAGHMVHFDEPAVVRSIVVRAHSTA